MILDLLVLFIIACGIGGLGALLDVNTWHKPAPVALRAAEIQAWDYGCGRTCAHKDCDV
jgi:hypothetical protein